jgi:hypothetical protein
VCACAANAAQTDIDRELTFLVLHALRGGPCAEAAATLERVRTWARRRAGSRARLMGAVVLTHACLVPPRCQEAAAHGLLPRRHAPIGPRGADGQLPSVAQTYAEARGAACAPVCMLF